ncbi:MAG: nickel pincer cofactor biosynthesis protein LarB [Acidobacteriia bacterium]|nr:nickel pincer cofactor biosynthesis protein LarB [Terriglobia bacterium]
MTSAEIKRILEKVKEGKLGVDEAMETLRRLPFEDLGFARIDHHRSLRVGFPEVVLGRGKSMEQVVGIVRGMLKNRHNILVTRSDETTFRAVRKISRLAAFHKASGALSIIRDKNIYGRGRILVISAGTADMPVAEEALVTARVMGNEVDAIYDCGVAGIHRLLQENQRLRRARVIVCVAGMEGALPSVVGGLVAAPVIAVPTSVGYGASFGGIAALLGMLNSCASNVTVVNIDNGFGAGYVASIINRLEN